MSPHRIVMEDWVNAPSRQHRPLPATPGPQGEDDDTIPARKPKRIGPDGSSHDSLGNEESPSSSDELDGEPGGAWVLF